VRVRVMAAHSIDSSHRRESMRVLYSSRTLTGPVNYCWGVSPAAAWLTHVSGRAGENELTSSVSVGSAVAIAAGTRSVAA
jgi:hypothetical protein